MDGVLNWVWQGCVVAMATAAMLRLVDSWRAAIRYRAVWVALVSILLLPVVPLIWAAAASPAPALANTFPSPEPILAIPAGWWTSETVLFVLWGAWSAVYGARIAAAAAALRRARRECRAAPGGLDVRLRRWSLIRTSGRPVRLVLSPRVRAAAVFGGRRPVIALAPILLDHLSDDELDRVVIHEWAHVQRRDDVAHALQLVVRMLAGWHPAVWWCDRQLRIERESACDEMALALTGSIKDYAACLTKLASLPRMSLPPLPVVSMLSSGLRGRIIRILSFDRVARSHPRAGAVIAASAGLGLMSLVVGGFPAIGATPARAPERFDALRETSTAERATDTTAAAVRSERAVAVAPAETLAAAGTSPTLLDDVRSAAQARRERRADTPASATGAATFANDLPLAEETTPRLAARATAPSAAGAAAPPAVEATAPHAVGATFRWPTPSSLTPRTVAIPPPAEWSMPIADAQASGEQVQQAPAPEDGQPVQPWTAAAVAGVAIGRGSQHAAVATAGFFNRFGRKIGSAF